MIKRIPYLGALLATLLGVMPTNEVHASSVIGKVINNHSGAITSSMLSDGDLLLVYNDATQLYSFTLPGPAQARILAVGGGGAGGIATGMATGSGGGGGAGGVLEKNAVLAAGSVSVQVGLGGAGASGIAVTVGVDGLPSSVTAGGSLLVNALGGGGGGGKTVGNNGASGGGGSKNSGGQGIAGQGNAGGSSTVNKSSGGGGGAGSEGTSVTTAIGGDGGVGIVNDISGSEVYYGGGGGGAVYGSGTNGQGGLGGGGNGAGATAATAGVDGLGGGGGGGNNNSLNGKGGDGVVIVRISAMLDGPIAKPTADPIVYDGELHTKIKEIPFAYTIYGTAAATDAGTYSLRVVLNEGFTWADGTAAEVNITWKITKAPNSISNLAIADWKEGNTPSIPTCVHQVGTVEYLYSDAPAGTYSSTVPSTAGTYYLKAQIAETPNYDGAAAGPVEFHVLEPGLSPMPSLARFADIYCTNYTGTATLTNFLMLIKVREGAPSGFEYSQTYPDGSDIRFCTRTGESLTYECDEWNPSGESVFWVKVPEFNRDTVLTMCWGKAVGADLPENVPTRTWDGYVGVWHMNGGSGVETDATGHKLNAIPNGTKPEQMTGDPDAVVGAGRVNQTTDGKFNRLSVPNYNAYIANQSVFTVSGWFKSTNATGYPRPMSRKNNYNDSTGWEIQYNSNSKTQCDMRGSSDKQVTMDGPDVTADWVYLTYVFNGTSGTAYANGEQKKSGTIAAVVSRTDPMAIGNNANGSEQGWCGSYDEVRFYNGSLQPDRIKADYEQMRRGGVGTFDIAGRDQRLLLENYWLVEPSITPTSWNVGEAPGVVTDGQPGYGTMTVQYRNRVNGEVLPGMPTGVGLYEIVYSVPSDGDYSALEKRVEFRIAEHSPYNDADGAQGANGRILLMNRDLGDVVVENQGYYDNAARYSTKGSFWEYVNTDGGNTGNLQAGTEFKYWTINYGKVLWHLIDCRHGNTFPTSGSGTAGLFSEQNYLPWSSTSKRISAHNSLSITRATVGWCVMRNTTEAKVYSSCFDEGIGTIYFDAVNGWNDTTADDYKLAVSVATNCLDAAGNQVDLPPTDANIHQIIPAHIECETNWVGGIEVVTTNYVAESTNYYGLANWKPVPMVSLKRDWSDAEYQAGISHFENEGLVFTNSLFVTNGGGTNNFYRLYVPLDYRGPARFKIERVSASGGLGADEGAFIILDNIIVSYPTMRTELAGYGVFDPSKSGKQILGQEAAWSVPFPSADGEVFARAKPTYYVNGGVPGADPSKFVVGAQMNYRWRYLDQKVDVWKSVFLDQNNGFKARSPLELPGIPGDIEYYFEVSLNSPFYDYFDYSGTGVGVTWSEDDGATTKSYSEEIPTLVNRATGVRQQSRGTDWYVRLREGESDYEAVDLIVRRGSKEAAGTESVIEMELTGNHVWRGYLKTLTNDVSDVWYRIRFRNRQTPGAETWSENEELFYSTTIGDGGIISGILSPVVGDGDWSVTKVDAATGYLMFQTDDSTRSITMVHADYQNFNGWNDAKKNVFVGTSTEDDAKSGASPVQREVDEGFDGWKAMPATDGAWTVPTLTDLGNLLGRKSYVPFASDTQNGWDIGQGMWVGRYYADVSDKAKNKGVAIQMEGQGRGFVQFIDKSKAPRGLESISFNARLGQFVGFNDFSYYEGGSPKSMKNYTFSSRVAFDLNGNKNFRGNASLSLAAYYRPGVGCYEARWEQLGGKWENGKCIGPNVENSGSRQRLCLYRWRATSSGAMKSTLLMAVTNTNFTIQSPTAINSPLQPLFISASTVSDTETLVIIGVGRDGWKADPINVDGSSVSQDKGFDGICYSDTHADRLKAGTYGVLSANCEGVFAAPVYYSQAVTSVPDTTPDRGSGKGYAQKKVLLPAKSTQTACYSNLDADDWMIAPGRTAYEHSDSSPAKKYLKSSPANQKLSIYTSPAGKTEWSLVKEVTISGFGTSSSEQNFVEKLYTTSDCSVRIAVGGTIEDARNDVVIDSVTLRQWRGDDYSHAEEMVPLIPNWEDPADYKLHTNFTFTTCWITNEVTKASSTSSVTNSMLLMSAKRTNPGRPCSICSPLFDGRYGRGIGIGMFAFSYKNAQPNAKLLLQIATNVTYNTIGTLETLETSPDWITVTNFTFTSAADRASGSRSCYIGMHNVSGVMRLIVDPAVVESVSPMSWKDPTKFGEILITEVFCRDEPLLDSACWWGWNLRTIGPDTAGADSEKRMYLPDLTTDPAKLGLSLALNNSVTDKTKPGEVETYKRNKPFVQTPTFAADVVGEIAFRARKYDANSSQPAAVMLYGSRTGSADGEWVLLNNGDPFVISNGTFSTYSYKTDPGQAFRAFRLCVNGVDGVIRGGDVEPDGYSNPVRVMIDEVVVSEAVRARVAFRNVGAFRSSMQTRDFVPNVPSIKEQPLCNEGWGVQCEVYAAQLPDDINFDIEPVVYLHYFVGDTPWGYENWSGDRNAKSVRLPMSVDSNLVYRSTYLGNYSDTVVPMSTSSEIVQYTLEVRYWQKGSTVAMTNFLNETEWKRPEWYRPLDLNRDYGKGVSFAAYNILDTVAPGWAWINEANVYGRYDSKWSNSERDAQFVEVAVPVEADITDWTVRLIGASMWDGTIVTNTIGRFGYNKLPGMKKDGGLYAASNMVFRVLGSPDSNKKIGGRLDPDKGELDGTWTFENESDTFMPGGEIFATDPFGIQLVRASGVIEHEVLCVGTNFYGSMPGLEDYYAPSNTVNFLNSNMRESRFFYVGQDAHAEGESLGVFASRGENEGFWNNSMKMTPGRINQNQTIDPDHPTPNGETILVYANIDSSVGHILQTVGDAVETNASVTVFIKRGSAAGTNITYLVDSWYELGSVEQNGKPAPYRSLETPKRTYVATVGVGASNNVTVIAKAKPKQSLIDEGLTPENPYTPAVLDWLVRHKNAYGDDWADPDADEVRPAQFISLSGNVVTNLTLTEMYWLDMDPTVGNLALRAGMVKPAMPQIVSGYMGTAADTNVEMSVYMMITNRTEDTASEHYGKAWTPYILRGLAPGETSWQYDNSSWGWTSVTFKVTGILANGHTSEDVRSDWIPLRWFVFHEDSFVPRGSANEGTSVIQVRDPYSKRSPGYTAGWYSWKEKYGEVPVFFCWALDMRRQPFSVEVLKVENKYDD